VKRRTQTDRRRKSDSTARRRRLWVESLEDRLLLAVDFAKAFTPATIGPGSASTLTFTLSNTDSSPATQLAFTDTLLAGVVIATPANRATTCGSGILTAPDGGGTISFSDGDVGGRGMCTVSVDVTSSTPGSHVNTSSMLTFDSGSSPAAMATLTVATNRPGFTKSFSPGAIDFGQRSTLTFTIDNTANASSVTFATFTDNLPTGLTIADPADASTDCGVSPTLTATRGTDVITLLSSGAPLPGFEVVPAGEVCTVSVDVVGAFNGTLVNSSDELIVNTGALSQVSSGKANAALDVTAGTVTLIKSFVDDPVPPGSTVEMQFTIANRDRDNPAGNISFTDDLDAALSGLVATGLPMNDVCTEGDSISGTNSLTYSGGSLEAGATCSFSVTLQVPVNAPTGRHTNTTSDITADVGRDPFTGAPGSDDLFVEAGPLLTKEFIDDPVGAGDAVTLRFTIENTSTTSAATDLAFTDSLDAALAGLGAGGGFASNVCGAGSMWFIGVDGLLSFTGGNLAASGSCTFDVTLDVPSAAAPGVYNNVTSDLLATIDGQLAMLEPAVDSLEIADNVQLLIEKTFAEDRVIAGGSVDVEFTITNLDESLAANDLAFTDDLGAALSGLVAVGLPAADVCGVGSTLAGSSVLTLSGGSLPPSGTCTFTATLQVPTNVAFGTTLLNTASEVTATLEGGLAVRALPASDSIGVDTFLFTKSFGAAVSPGETTTLSFAITNISTVSEADDIRFADDLDRVLSGLAAVGLPATDVCGEGSQISGTSQLTLTGGVLGPGESCSFDVTVLVPGGAPGGSFVNLTSDLTLSGERAAGPATATLQVMLPAVIIDNDDPGYSDSGNLGLWTNQGFQGDVREAVSGGTVETATYSFTGLNPGDVYFVSTTWTPFVNRAAQAPYQIAGVENGPANVLVNQRVAPDDFQDQVAWERLGVFTVDEGGQIQVTISGTAPGNVIADAVRIDPIVGPEIEVREGGVALTSGASTIDFGTRLTGTDVRKTILVTNIGPSALTLGIVSGRPALS